MLGSVHYMYAFTSNSTTLPRKSLSYDTMHRANHRLHINQLNAGRRKPHNYPQCQDVCSGIQDLILTSEYVWGLYRTPPPMAS